MHLLETTTTIIMMMMIMSSSSSSISSSGSGSGSSSVVVVVVVVAVVITIIFLGAISCGTCSIVLNKCKYKNMNYMHIRHPNSVCPNNHAQKFN